MTEIDPLDRDTEAALAAALHLYNNDLRLLRAQVEAAGGVLTLYVAGAIPEPFQGSDLPVAFRSAITVRLEDLPPEDGDPS